MEKVATKMLRIIPVLIVICLFTVPCLWLVQGQGSQAADAVVLLTAVLSILWGYLLMIRPMHPDWDQLGRTYR